MKSHSRGWRATVAALALALVGGAAAVAPAVAAPTHETEATISDLEFVSESVTGTQFTQISGNWSLPDNPAVPAGFILQLPSGLQGRTLTFPLTLPDGSTEIGECSTTETTLHCDIDDDYIATNPDDISGEFSMWVRITEQTTQETTRTFEFDNVEGSITITHNPPATCTDDCAFTGTDAQKYGYQLVNGNIEWTVRLPYLVGGDPGGREASVVDTLGPGQSYHPEIPAFLLIATELGVGSDGRTRPSNWTRVDPSEYSVSPDGTTVSWTTVPGAYYDVRYTVIPDNPANNTEYTNEAAITIEGEEVRDVTTRLVYQGGSGTGIGQGVGRFSIAKDVTGTAEVPEDLVYTVNYTVTTPEGTTTEHTAAITGEGTFTSPTYPRGSTVQLTEVKPADSDAVTWSEPDFSSESFELVGGQQTDITLTNEATLNTGTFSASKSLDDPADLVDPGTTFALTYTYPAGDGFPAGSGSLSLPADGTVVTSEDLPVGAVLTLAESAPADVPGATWGASAINPSTVTIGSADPVTVSVTNTLTQNVGGFSVSKSVSGTGVSQVPAGTVFTVEYSYPEGDGFEAGAGTLEVLAGETSTVDGIPAGAEVSLTEVRATDPEGATWGEPEFDVSTFTVIQDSTVEIDLDNPIDLNSGEFSILKSVDGTGSHLVNSDREFTVEYSYPEGEGYAAGEGELIVRADGTAVTSGDLPYGAEVSLTEAAPATVEGGSWTGFEFSDDTITIGDGTVVEVDLVNSIDEVPEEPTTPEEHEPGTPTAGGDLPRTGVEIGSALGLALALLLAGGTAVAVARKKRASAEA